MCAHTLSLDEHTSHRRGRVGREGGVRGVRREVGVQGLVVGTGGRGDRNREGRV